MKSITCRRLLAWLSRRLRSRSAPRARAPRISASVAEEKAQEEARHLGILWEEPIATLLVIHEASPCWLVRSNWPSFGFGMDVYVDGETGMIVRTHLRTP